MGKHTYLMLILAAVFFASTPMAKGTIVDITGYFSFPTADNPPWIFDYELQTLTAIGNVHLQPDTSGEFRGGYHEPWGYNLMCRGGTVGQVSGTADSDSAFHVNASFKNETDIPWTAWVITWGGPRIPLVDVTYVSSSILTDATDTLSGTQPAIILSGGTVLPGEVLTINIDVFVAKGRFWDHLSMAPIPEPSTVVLLGLGGIGLICRKRNKKAK